MTRAASPKLLNLETATDGGHVRVLPLHLLTARERKRLGLATKRGMGRPRRIEVPIAIDTDYAEQMQAAREAHAAADPLVVATGLDRDGDPQKTIHAAIEGISVETAALLHDRLVAEARGQDISVIASRRLEGLDKIGHLCLRAKKLDAFAADISGAQFEKVEQMWLDMLREVARDVLPSETGALVMDRMVAAMEAWRASLADPGRGPTP